MKLLITGAANPDAQKLNMLSEMGNEVFFMQNESEAVPVPCEEIEGIIGNGIFLHHKIENFPKLKYIQLTSAGFDRAPMEYIEKNGIQIHNARGVYSIPIAEFVLSSVLAMLKNFDFFRENQKNGKYEKNRNISELYRKNVCIVGCGSIGTECAKRFEAFGCTVSGVDLSESERAHFKKVYPIEEIQKAVSAADVVVLALPITEKTFHLFDGNLLSKMKDGSIIVNVSRGAIIDTEALLKELGSGRINAILDVFEEEPLKEDSPLWKMNNVYITPHNSFFGEGNSERLWNIIVSNLKDM